MIPTNQRDILPISFPVNVVGIRQQATVLADVSDMASFRYRVRFEDGFEDIFTIIEGPEISIEGKKNGFEYYASALLSDLYILTNIEPVIFFYTLPMMLEGESINVWLMQEEPTLGDEECVMVSYNQRLQFELYLADGSWKYRELKRPLTTAEKKLAIELTDTMESIRSILTLG